MVEAQGYSRTQIGLHWIIAALIALQYLMHEPIAQAWEATQAGEAFSFQPMIAAHVAGGIAILVLVLWRLVLRAAHGAPPPPELEPVLLRLGSKVAHGALYLLMLAMPITGLAAWFGGVVPAADLHEVFKVALLALIGLHVLAVLVHQFVLRTRLLRRMMRPA